MWVVFMLWICISFATDGKGLAPSGSRGPVPAVSKCQASSLSPDAQVEEEDVGPVIAESWWSLLVEMPLWL